MDSATTPKAVVVADGLGFRYPGGSGGWVFRGLDFSVSRGAVLGILGPNGRGKTTLLKTVLGLVRPGEGSVALAGESGYVPQSSPARIAYTVLNMVVMGRARKIGVFGTPGNADYRAAQRALDRLGIGNFRDRVVTGLSGGERQLVLIARAIASDCSVLVLDEPASALDFRNQQVILSTLRSLADEGMTILFTTHNPQHALRIADQVLLMHSADAHSWGPVMDVLTDDNLRRVYDMDVRNLGFDLGQEAHRAILPIFR
jgi:iron complex transport system ATP-binding protein